MNAFREVKMKLILFAVLLVVTGFFCTAESTGDFDNFVKKYKAADVNTREELTRSFITRQRTQGGFPIIETGGNVVFFYVGTGKEQDVRLTGEFRTLHFHSIYWDKEGEAMRAIAPKGGVFFKRLKFETDARLEYKFIIDGEPGRDPLNPRTAINGAGGEVSQLVMPGYIQPADVFPKPGIAGGRIIDLDEEWATPAVKIYLPAGYDSSKTYPVIYTADGSAWIKFMALPVILDNLIAARDIEPVMAVMIDSAKDRRSWYFYNPKYLDYLEKVVKYVDKRFATRADAGSRLHIGASSGGRAAFYVGLERPGLFLNLGLFSPSLTGSPYYYEPYFSGRKRPHPALRIWLSAGSYEEYIYKDTKVMEKYFKSVGPDTTAVYTREGHSFIAWRNLTPLMLKHFFPAVRGFSCSQS